MSDEPGGYQTYLLRLWSVQIQGKREWRASIENPHTGERQSFTSLEQCFTFLRDLCSSQASGMPQAGKGLGDEKEKDHERG